MMKVEEGEVRRVGLWHTVAHQLDSGIGEDLERDLLQI